MSAVRWEDVTPIWMGPQYTDYTLRYAPTVDTGYLSGRLITSVDVVDWSGTGTRDLLLSAWDACYDGRVFLRREIGQHRDGTPIHGEPSCLNGVEGYVTTVPDGDIFHLISTSRLRCFLLFYENVGSPGAPKFGIPRQIKLDADWVNVGETLHLARFVDIDGDGSSVLLVGTDYWNDYWPDGIEWNESGYCPYDGQRNWRGGRLRGYLYAFKNIGKSASPRLERGTPVLAGGKLVESYGQLAPLAAKFRGNHRADLLFGDFLTKLQYVASRADGGFESPRAITNTDGEVLELDHCIHFPCAVDWNGNGRIDLLVGAEDGYVSLLENDGSQDGGFPVFRRPVRLRTEHPELHAGVLPVPAAFDWQGHGRLDLVVGNSAGELLFYENLGDSLAPVFGEEVALCADGKRIRIFAGSSGSIQGPSEERFGYTCPTVADWDGDGNADLLVSDILGQHLFYRNTGTSHPPEFEAPLQLQFEGRPLRTVWRVRPAVVDWQGDGVLSYLTLDEEGCLSTYFRENDTTLVNKRLLCWESGEVMRFTEDLGGGLGRIKLCIADWTDTGTYDLIIGTHGRASVPPGPLGQPRHTTGQAGVLLLENVSDNRSPRFASPKPIKFQGEPFAGGMHACAPEVVAWNRGSALDLVVGLEDGSLVWLPRSELSW